MINVENLHKTYRDRRRGDVHAVEDVSFECRSGEIFGLLGPNGAGKTTTLRIISTALKPSRGTARVMGADVVTNASQVRRHIGFLSANTGLYGRLTSREILVYFGKLFGMPARRIRERLDEVTEIFDLSEFLTRPCDKLSTGMRQRVNIARAIFHDPPVMIFDEPTSGLDVLSSRTIVRFIHQCREQQKTVLFSTHIMSEVGKLCDHVALIHHGKLHFNGTIGELREKHGDDMEHAFLRIIGEEQ